jgi:hypothetical protein
MSDYIKLSHAMKYLRMTQYLCLSLECNKYPTGPSSSLGNHNIFFRWIYLTSNILLSANWINWCLIFPCMFIKCKLKLGSSIFFVHGMLEIKKYIMNCLANRKFTIPFRKVLSFFPWTGFVMESPNMWSVGQNSMPMLKR